MARLEITCKTASTVLNGVETKPSITLLESTVHLDPRKIPTAESIQELREQFSNIAVLYGLPQGEVCTCEVVLIE